MQNALFRLLALGLPALPAVAQDNAELERLFDADQATREAGNIDWEKRGRAYSGVIERRRNINTLMTKAYALRQLS